MPDLDADTLPEHIAGFEVLIVRSTKVTAAALDQADSLGLIVRAGAGTNTIDCDRAAELGVFVCNVPGKNALAVAELTMGLLLAITALGIFGLTSYAVAGRTKQIGTRRALGAKRLDIVRYFLVEQSLISWLGLALGLVLAVVGLAVLVILLIGLLIAVLL